MFVCVSVMWVGANLEHLGGQQHVDPGEMEEAHYHHKPHPWLVSDVMPGLAQPAGVRGCWMVLVEIYMKSVCVSM